MIVSKRKEMMENEWPVASLDSKTGFATGDVPILRNLGHKFSIMDSNCQQLA
jgi:hypothetical protein